MKLALNPIMRWKVMQFTGVLGMVSALTLLFASAAFGFQILSVASDPCHERITMGTLGRDYGEFNGDGLPQTTALLNRLVSHVETYGVPTDKATRGFINQLNNRYRWDGYSMAERFVLASFIAGVRSPDTNGFSIADINKIRGIHIRDREQSRHSLRRIEQDGADGDVAAIEEAKSRVWALMTATKEAFDVPGSAYRGEKWNFAFYGDQIVQVLVPAFNLGLAAHVIQDSYAHMIRDASFDIVAVSNYVEVITDALNEERDGPAHSDRLDHCNVEDDAFDSMRVHEARRQTARLFNTLEDVLQAGNSDFTQVLGDLADIFSYRSGCLRSNSYCDTEWYKKSAEDISQPFSAGCGWLAPARPHDHRHDHHQGDGGDRAVDHGATQRSATVIESFELKRWGRAEVVVVLALLLLPLALMFFMGSRIHRVGRN